jgi:phosphoglycolate phosphatase-like HAD superfamily hydrolase
MIACVAFDFDGTLVDSNHVKLRAFYEIVEAYDPSGATVTEVLQQCPNEDRYGITRELVRNFMAKGQLRMQSSREALSAQWAEAYTKICQKSIVTCTEVPGASVILEWLSDHGIPAYVNSRTPTDVLNRLVALRGFTHYFSGIYGAPASKLENLRRLQGLARAKPDEILFVGDSEDDRKAAAALGCHFVGVILGDNSRFRQIPLFHVKNLEELRAIMDNLQENQNVLVPNK